MPDDVRAALVDLLGALKIDNVTRTVDGTAHVKRVVSVPDLHRFFRAYDAAVRAIEETK